VSILAILIFIAWEVYPLWKKPKAGLVAKINLTQELTGINWDDLPSPLALGIEEYREIAFVPAVDGAINFFSPITGKVIESARVKEIEPGDITASRGSLGSKGIIMGTSTGEVVVGEINFSISFISGKRTIRPTITVKGPIKVDQAGQPLSLVTFKGDEEQGAAAALTADGRLVFFAYQKGPPTLLLGEGKREEFRHDLTQQLQGEQVRALALDHFLENLYIGTQHGHIYNWAVRDKRNLSLVDKLDATGDRRAPVTALGFLIGERSLMVGDAAGNVSTWMQIANQTSPGKTILRRGHVLNPHPAAVTAVAGSSRNKGFVSADVQGNIFIHHATSEQTLLELKGEGEIIKALAFAPKADGVIALDGKGVFYHWEVDNPHPEINLKTLFGKVWYEGYQKPEYVWQSTGGSDDFEPKISLTPLVYGTFKGTFYALIFAIPLAVLGAIYTSQLMHPNLKGIVKPSIEIMAALPSVVLGFLAGLWIAPLLEKILPAVLIMPLVIISLILVAVFIWQYLPRDLRQYIKPGTEVFLLIPIICLGIYISILLNHSLEDLLFGGDYRKWFYEHMGLRYDQRNSVVVGFAMGFAVIPIIFTISEDALSAIPRHLIAGSFALGATRWQTAIRMVLPAASPGIYSAIMIGFGRAVGETMIVLMATGNTPVMDWSPFNGFRALSANIAVELPEAPYHGTLYRVLLLAALLLFVLTFIMNTAAELVRMRLRKKYSQL